MILVLKTDQDPTEICLLDNNGEVVAEKKWNAERTLAKNLLGEIEKLVGDWTNLTGIVVFQGPGGFTGLRIGIATANALAYSLNIPIVGADGKNWRTDGSEKLKNGQNDRIVLPEYGASPHITVPKK